MTRFSRGAESAKADALPPRSDRPRRRSFDFLCCVFFSSSAFREEVSPLSAVVSEELEELCQAPNHINESGGESGGEFWLSTASGQDDPNANPGAKIEPSENNTSVSDLVVI